MVLRDLILRQGQKRHPLLLLKILKMAMIKLMSFMISVSCSKDIVDGPLDHFVSPDRSGRKKKAMFVVFRPNLFYKFQYLNFDYNYDLGLLIPRS